MVEHAAEHAERRDQPARLVVALEEDTERGDYGSRVWHDLIQRGAVENTAGAPVNLRSQRTRFGEEPLSA